MATIEISGDDVVLKLSHMETLEAAHMHSSVSAPVSAVQSVEAVDDAWNALQGHKDVGTEIPGDLMVGTRGGDFCAVHKHAPGVVITFTPGQSEYGRWVFTGDINDVPAGLKR